MNRLPAPPNKFPFGRSIRGRLLFSAILVEAIMLLLLVSNSLRLMNQHMTAQTHRHADQLSPVLLAALVAPMAQRDYATIQAVLDESRRDSEVKYFVVTNSSGVIVASNNWNKSSMPPTAGTFDEATESESSIYRVEKPIVTSDQVLGKLYFGLDLSEILLAKNSMLFQGFFIAMAELLLSIGLLTLIGIWLTRQFVALTHASEEVKQGNLSPPVLPVSNNEVGSLCAAFNAMSQAVSERVEELTKSHKEQQFLTSMVKEEQSRMAALLSSMDLGVLLLDMNGIVIYENPAFRKIFGIDVDTNLAGTSGKEIFVHRMSQLSVDTSLWQDSYCEASRDTHHGHEILWQDGRTITQRSQVVTNDVGAAIGMLLIFNDVTIEKQAAQQLVNAKELAEKSRRVQAAFLAAMSHEIRTPMNGIIGMTNLILMTDLKPDQREYLTWIKASSDSLLTVLNDILDFSKIDSGQMTVETIPFQLHDLVKEVVGLYSTTSNQKGVQLSWRLAHGTPYQVIGDPVRLRQILTNLVSNAVKFTEEGHVSLSVSMSRNGPDKNVFIRFSITDTGIGISEDKLQEIFAPFTQADGSTTRKFGGSGLGLAIVKKLVELLNGEVAVTSKLGEGSIFHVIIPVDLPETESKDIDHLEAPADTESNKIISQNVLLVEDTPVNQRLGQIVLQNLGHKVVVASDGIEAVSAFQSGGFDVILMDMQMPNMDGLEATRRIRLLEKEEGLGSHIPIIAVTANAMETDRLTCLKAGMDDYISKPFQVEKLAAMLVKYQPQH